MWMNHEGHDSPMSHSHNVNHNHMTLCTRGAYSLHSNPGDNDDYSDPNGSNSVSGYLHGSGLYSCWVCGMQGHLS